MTWCGSHKTRPLRLTSARPRRLLPGIVAVAGTVAYSASSRTVPTAGAAGLAPAGAAACGPNGVFALILMSPILMSLYRTGALQP